MDDVEIADVDESGEVLPEEGEKVLKRQQQQHDHLSSVGFMVGESLWAYGCYLLLTLAALCTLLIYLAKKRRSRSLPAPTLQDAEEVVRRQEAMEASRRKMQQEQDAKAAIFREKRKQVKGKRAKRKQAERKQAERKQAERKQAERKQAERKLAERKQAERKQAERKQPERKQPERKQAERKQPERKQPERKQPERKQPERKQPERKQPERKQPKRSGETAGAFLV